LQADAQTVPYYKISLKNLCVGTALKERLSAFLWIEGEEQTCLPPIMEAFGS
jgi:hypothetical protein